MGSSNRKGEWERTERGDEVKQKGEREYCRGMGEGIVSKRGRRGGRERIEGKKGEKRGERERAI